jgi:ATP-dependent DNA helicase RecG
MADAPLTLRNLADMGVTVVSGIGPKKAEKLESVGVTTVLDVLTRYPRRYLDRTRQANVRDLVPGDEATLMVQVLRTNARKTRNGRSLVTVDVGDGTGTISCTFFNQAWRQRQLTAGTTVLLYGKVDTYRGALQMSGPVVDLLGDRTGRIIPVYPQSGKASLTTWEFAGWIEEILRRCERRGLGDPVPSEFLQRHNLIDRHRAFHQIHNPADMGETTLAHNRLVFDELLRVQLALVLRKQRLAQTQVGRAFDVEGEMFDMLRGRLGFELTGAQDRVIEEIVADLSLDRPMHRLLQGDVGAGKTLVAVAAMLHAVEDGHQAAMMAPTEVLAEQHYMGVRELVGGITVAEPENLLGERELRVGLLTNRTTGADRKRLIADLEAGTVDIIVGTHSLIQDKVKFSSLGLAVVDEQHRFGVEQRAALRTKNADGTVPHVLVMTATPIPRTAAMTVYGDLDVSTLDELPPGRTPIDTKWVAEPEALALMWGHVRDEIAAGRQVYVVCPLIEESDKLEASSAESVFEELAGGELYGLSLALLHGRMAAADKESVMHRFRSADVEVLVATTVIEVGVDVPNATVMVILDADRFGIAQLHQLRGRVGRGAAESSCYLVGEPTTADGEARLQAMVDTTDGFKLAEVDLDLRGEGTIMGERQKGQNDLKLASLARDRRWVERAREAAVELVDGGDFAARHPLLAQEVELFLPDEDAEFLMKG